MVGTMALLTSLSMPTSVVEESCMRERRSASPNSPVSARIGLAPAAKQNRRQNMSSSDASRRRQRHAALPRRSRHHREHSEDEDEESGDDYDDDEAEADEEDELDPEMDERPPRRSDASGGQQHAIALSPHRPASRQHIQQQQLQQHAQQHTQQTQQQQHTQHQQQQQLYSLRWHDFQASILSSFRHLRDVEDFVDVTLACDGKSFTAHKMVLSACSPYFRHLLKANPCQHPIVILRDVKYRDMEALLRFMYNGEVSVSNEQLPSVLHTARMLQVKGLADVPPTKRYPNKRVPDYSNETPSSRDSSAERRPASMNPSRKRARSRSPSPSPVTGISISSSAAAVMAGANRPEEDRAPLAPLMSNENGQRDEDRDDDNDDDEDVKTLDEKQQQQLLLDVHRDSLLSQALEGRSSQSLMAHLLATRMSGNQSETSSRSGGPGPVPRPSSAHQVEDDVASDSDDTDASDRDRTDVGDLSNTEDNVYPSSGMMGEHPLGRSSLHHQNEMMPPAGFAGHHPLLNLQSLHSLFPGGSIPGGNGSAGAGGLHAGRVLEGQNNNNNNNDLAQATRRSLDLMRIRATDPRPCPQCGKIYRSAHTLRTHLEDKHTVCPGYRCVLCGTVAKSRNSLHSHMSRQHRGISTKDLPVVPMPAPFDPVLASCLLAKAGVKVSPAELAARASPTSGNPRGRTADLRLDFKSPSGSLPPGTLPPQVTIGGLQSHRNNPLQLIPLDTDPEDLSLAQQRLRGDSNRDLHHHREKSGNSGGAMGMSPYGPAVAAGLVNRLGLSGKMGKNWLETNMAAALQQQQQQLHQQAGSPGANPNAPGGGSGGTGSALLDTYLQLIAEHSSNMAAVAAAAAAAQNAAGQPNNNNHSSDGDRPDSANPMDACDKRSPNATSSD